MTVTVGYDFDFVRSAAATMVTLHSSQQGLVEEPVLLLRVSMLL